MSWLLGKMCNFATPCAMITCKSIANGSSLRLFEGRGHLFPASWTGFGDQLYSFTSSCLQLGDAQPARFRRSTDRDTLGVRKDELAEAGDQKVLPTTFVMPSGISPFLWGVSLWEALSVVSLLYHRSGSSPTALRWKWFRLLFTAFF